MRTRPGLGKFNQNSKWTRHPDTAARYARAFDLVGVEIRLVNLRSQTETVLLVQAEVEEQ
jgi:hypothetical protein